MSLDQERTTEDMIGRADVNDIEAILAITNTDRDAVISVVQDNSDAIFTWDYEKGARPSLEKLYEKAKHSMWDGEKDLPWETEVDQEQVVLANADMNGGLLEFDVAGTPFEKWTDKEWIQVGIESQNWTLSQFMHGEQGAMICTAKIVETVPWIDAKYYASTQVMDEARHVAFGVLSLQEFYAELSDAEIFERQQFAFEAAVRMRDRFLQQEVWERMGVPVKDALELVMLTPTRQMFQMMLFSKVVPNCKKLGLLDRNDKWLRHRFEEIGVIQFEDWADTASELEGFALLESDIRST